MNSFFFYIPSKSHLESCVEVTPFPRGKKKLPLINLSFFFYTQLNKGKYFCYLPKTVINTLLGTDILKKKEKKRNVYLCRASFSFFIFFFNSWFIGNK